MATDEGPPPPPLLTSPLLEHLFRIRDLNGPNGWNYVHNLQAYEALYDQLVEQHKLLPHQAAAILTLAYCAARSDQQ